MYPTAWGKTDKRGGYHALSAHSMDVSAVFFALCRLPVISARLNCAAGHFLTREDLLCLAALVFLHDVGKLMPGFQAKGRPELLCAADVNHSEAGWRILRIASERSDYPLAAVLRQIGSWGAAVEPLLAAVFAHHGRPVSSDRPSYGAIPVVAGYDMTSATVDLRRMWNDAFPNLTNVEPLPGNPAFVHLFAGLVALADWIGSDRAFFDFVPQPGADYPSLARHKAADALAAIGLDLAVLGAPDVAFEAVAGSGRRPNLGQRLVAEAELWRSLLLLEAETGSGKTEAALWRFVLLHAAGLVSGLYFAVPTRAAARQLHRRVNAAARRMFGPSVPEAILAIPGLRVAGEAIGHPLPDFQTRWDDEGPHPGRWAAEHATRFLAAPIAVGTVDQAMLSALQVKHAPLRGAALSRSLLVIDEVHASDAYMTEILAELLKGHLGAGGQAMLMSATLGSSARARFLGQSLPDLATALASPYPALWRLGAPAPAQGRPEGRNKTVRMETAPSMAAESVATVAIAAARGGARVLVIRNTVGAATDCWRAVRAAGAEALLMSVNGRAALHHSRFAAEDRAMLDAAAEAALAARSDRPAGGVIVIGTQTLEQSLDIDADFLITDLCPMDVLLQRIGRLHRHALPRPEGFAEPRCLVLKPEIGLDALAEPRFFNGLGAWKESSGAWFGIYMDLPCLALTAALVAQEPDWRIPEMNRRLVESATHPEARTGEIARRGPAWSDYEMKIGGRDAAIRTHARLKQLRRDQPFPERFLCDEEEVMTRLGAQGLVLDLAPDVIGPFGTQVRRITLPAYWQGLTPPEGLVEAEPLSEGFRIRMGKSTLLYGPTGLRHEQEG